MRKVIKGISVAGALAFATFCVCSPALAQQESTPASRNQSERARSTNTHSTDETFARNAEEGGMAEVDLGKLAQERAQNPEVKKFAQRMVEDHTKANEELKQLASREGIHMPTNVSRKDANTQRELEKLSGSAFDKAYAQHMVQDHEKDISEFKQMASSAQNAALRQFAQQTLPTLESHLQEAKQMQAAVSREGVSKR